jgi:hypothetical protein
MIRDADRVHVRHMVDDVAAALHFCTKHLGSMLLSNYAPAFADARRGRRITPLPSRRSPVLPPRVAARPKALLHTVAFRETVQRQFTVAARTETVRPFGNTIVVERTSPNSAEHGTCALCWTGPGPLAGIVRRDTANAAEARAICSRCLVTFEMLAAQFDSRLDLHIEAPA